MTRIHWRPPTRLPGTPPWLRLNLGRGRISSTSLRVPLGPLGALTHNVTTGRWSWDHPGPGSFTLTPGPRRRRGGGRR